MASPMRFYLRTGDAEFRPVFWIHNNKPNEMLFGLYGLSQKNAELKYMWEDRLLEPSDHVRVTYPYGEAIQVNQPVDHITCHADGRFHIKAIEGTEIYTHVMQRTQPLGSDTSIFLDLMILSDEAGKYRSVGRKVRYPHAWFGLSADQYVSLKGMFSGSNFALEKVAFELAASYPGQHACMTVSSGTIKGLFFGHPSVVPESARPSRPQGTMLSFRFPTLEGKWRIKTFIFE